MDDKSADMVGSPAMASPLCVVPAIEMAVGVPAELRLSFNEMPGVPVSSKPGATCDCVLLVPVTETAKFAPVSVEVLFPGVVP